MDETGFPEEATQTQRVIGRRGTKLQHKQGTADKETVTALVTICADGSVLQPTIIFKGKNLWSSWGANNVTQASFACSPNGWTDGELAMRWMVDDFDTQTRDKAEGRLCCLYLDGHSSYYNLELLQYALDHGIVILGYPAKCTHALQGLDVVCFARMKLAWTEAIEAFELANDHGLGKSDFAGVFGAAFLKAFTPDTVKMAFEKTGIYPYNPNVITETQMKPSTTTSTQDDRILPFKQNTPIKTLMAVWDTPERRSQGPVTPTRRGISERDPNIDPALYTPSERAQRLKDALSTSSSTAHLM
ncbi:hypothetical protein M422DRAFT_191509, partial [Sphaerobolus stellatus SS14]